MLSFSACHRRGGVERILVECANFLAARGHDTTVLTAMCDAGVLHPSIHTQLLAVNRRGTVGFLRAYQAAAAGCWAELRSGAGAPVHAAFGVTSPPDGVLWVTSVHAEWLRISRASRNFLGRLKQRLNPFHPYILRLERDYYRGRKYRRLIALTPRVKSEVMEHYGVPAGDIDILPNGYNPDEFSVARRSSERHAVRAQLGYLPDDKVLLFVANELERKGFFPLLEALAALRSPQVKLLVVGKASLAGLGGRLARLGIQAQVRSVGVSADAGRYYAAADVFVLPTYYEAWGLVIVEALASGLPVLTSRLAGAAAAVRADTGILLDDPRDPAAIATGLDKLLRGGPIDPQRISESVESYRWPRLLERYEAILQSCAA